MKIFSTIDRYIFLQFIPPFLACFLFLNIVFFLTQIPEITNMLIKKSIGLFPLLKLLIYAFPEFLEVTLPMSVMISILLTFMRMAGENEIVSLKSSGITLYRLLVPVSWFCLLGFCLGIFFSVQVVPASRLAFKTKSMEFAKNNIETAIQERQFNTFIDGIMVYVSSIDTSTDLMKDILVEDQQTKGLINITTAPEGRLIYDKEKKQYLLRLFNGRINHVGLKDKSVNMMTFSTYEYNLDLTQNKNMSVTRQKDIDECTFKELTAVIKSKDATRLKPALIEWHKKFSLPFACLSLGLLAFPLGIQSVSLRRSSGFGMGLCFFMIYYTLMGFGVSFGEKANYPPALGMWLPNILMGGMGGYMLMRNVKDKPLKITFRNQGFRQK